MIDIDAVSTRRFFHLPKYLNLPVGERSVCFMRAREMTHESFDGHKGKITTSFKKCRHFMGLNTDAPHPGVNFQMHGDSLASLHGSLGQTLDHVERADNRLETIRHKIFALFSQS